MNYPSLVMDLNRPQYSANPELLLSAVVGESFSSEGHVKNFRFLSKNPNSTKLAIGPTGPTEMARFAQGLDERGVRVAASHQEDLAKAVVAAISGVPSRQGTSIPVSPMTRGLTLAQDPAGVLGSNNPPNLGRILEVMFAMGSPAETQDTLASLWDTAATKRVNRDPLLKAIDDLMASAHPGGPFHADPIDLSAVDPWRGLFPDSPYAWLAQSWRRLMSPEWLDRLPPRVWTDWSTTVLRNALAFGFLAEMNWYVEVGEMLLADKAPQRLPALRTGITLLPWPPARLQVQSRNVKSEIRQAVLRGTAVRQVLHNYEVAAGPVTTLEAVHVLRDSADARVQVEAAMGHPEWTRSCKNTYETILYALQDRGSSDATDYYCLLKSRGTRYSVVAPGTEWIAVVCSLACPRPDSETNIGEVVRSLASLGLRPELHELVRLLELAGLATGSADADHGVRVRSAF